MTPPLLRLPLRGRIVHRSLCPRRTYAVPSAAPQPRPSTSKPPHAGSETKSVSEAARSLLGKTKVQEFLDYVASSSAITLADAERCRPTSHAPPGSLQYEEDHQNAVDTLMRSFNSKQLRHILGLYGSTPRPQRTKRSYAVNIVEHHWGWPSLVELQKQRRDTTEIVSTTYQLTPYQSFLLLGRDGADLLSLSSKYHARLHFQADPFSLKVEGLRGSIRRLELYIEELKSGITREEFQLPISKSLSPEKLQHVSRMSGAFVENVDTGKVRIYSRAGDQLAPVVARRLAVQASLQAPTDNLVTLALPLHPSREIPSNYGVFPFRLPRSTPWLPKNTKLHRLRRVAGETECEEKPGEEANLEIDVTSLDGLVIDTLNLYPQPERNSLIDSLHFSKSLNAIFGHSLLAFPRSALLSQLRDPLGSFDISSWLRSQSADRIFVPMAPAAFCNTIPSPPTTYLRLVYQPTGPLFGEASISYEVPISLNRDNLQQLEVTLAECKFQQERAVDVLVPERATDLQILASTSAVLPRTAWPQELLYHHSEILNRLETSQEAHQIPEPPLTFSWNSQLYALSSYLTIRRFKKPKDEHSTGLLENVTDLTTRQKISVGKIVWSDVNHTNPVYNLVKICSQYISPPTPLTSVPSMGELEELPVTP